MKIKKLKRKKGVTLIEIIIVLLIMGSIIAITIRTLTKSQKQAEGKIGKLKMQMDWAKLNTALADYKQIYGNYPDANTGLEALVNPPDLDDGKKQPSLLDRESILDQWRKPYHFQLTDDGFKIITLGADGAIGGEGINEDIDIATVP